MTCSDALHLVEAIAAGDLEVDETVRTHFETCPRCASALASARRLEVALQARPKPQAPARFTQAVLGRIRQERWRSEQRVDRVFNVAIGWRCSSWSASVLALTNVDAVLGGAGSLWGLLAAVGGQALAAAAPVLVTYVAAAGPADVCARHVVVGGSAAVAVGSVRVQGSAFKFSVQGSASHDTTIPRFSRRLIEQHRHATKQHPAGEERRFRTTPTSRSASVPAGERSPP